MPINPLGSLPLPSLSKLPGFLTKLAGSGVGNAVLGFVASPPFGDLRAEFDSDVNKKLGQAQEEPSGIKKTFNFLRNRFAWGDVFTIVGIGLWVLHSKFMKSSEGEQGSAINGWIGLASRILTFAGTPLARLGQMMDLHRQKALGPEKYGEAYISLAEKTTGKRVFEDVPIDKVREKMSKLKPLLAYNSDVERNVLYRHDSQRGITGLLYGEPGTGKTTGAELILGNWAAKQQSLGYEPVVQKLNVAVLDEYQEKNRKKVTENIDLLQSSLDLLKSANEDAVKLLTQTLDDPLIALEMLIRKARAAVDEVDKYNESIKDDPTKKKKQLALFIDEFDKVVDWSLKGADKGKLIRLVTEFNDLCDNSNLLMTSNKKIEAFVGAFRQAGLPEEEVIRPFEDRLRRNPVYITLPKPETQARIIANNLLYRISSRQLLDLRGLDGEKIDLENCRSDTERSKKLQEIIYRSVSSLPGSNNINGRHIEVAMSSKLESELSGIASEMREESDDKLGCSEEEWDRLSAYEKAEKAGVKIDIPLILKLITVQQRDYLGETKGAENNEQQSIANLAFKTYLAGNIDLILEDVKKLGPDGIKGLRPEQMFSLFTSIYQRQSKGGYTVYLPKEETTNEATIYSEDGKGYLPCIRVSNPGRGIEPVVEIGLIENDSSSGYDVRWSSPIKLSEFVKKIQEELAIAFEKKFGFSDLFTKLFNLITGGAGSDPRQFLGALLGEIEKRGLGKA